MEERLLTVDELCEWLQIGRATLWRWRKQGMPYIKHGNSVRFDKADVLEWLKQQDKK
jgi:excisionase family DNA binding protein